MSTIHPYDKGPAPPPGHAAAAMALAASPPPPRAARERVLWGEGDRGVVVGVLGVVGLLWCCVLGVVGLVCCRVV